MTSAKRLSAVVSMLVIAVFVAVGIAALAGNDDHPRLAQANQSADPGQVSLPPTGADLAAEVMGELGYQCHRQADVLFRADRAWVEPLEEAALAVGNRGWLRPAEGKWAPGQGWVGKLSEVVAAYEARVLDNTPELVWLLSSKDGVPYAFSVRPVNLSNGALVWLRKDWVEPVDCGLLLQP